MVGAAARYPEQRPKGANRGVAGIVELFFCDELVGAASQCYDIRTVYGVRQRRFKPNMDARYPEQRPKGAKRGVAGIAELVLRIRRGLALCEALRQTGLMRSTEGHISL